VQSLPETAHAKRRWPAIGIANGDEPQVRSGRQYIPESGRIMMDGPAKALAENKDVKEFYLGISSEGRKSFRDMKPYRRRKRWVCMAP
jgi:hypothetical protein